LCPLISPHIHIVIMKLHPYTARASDDMVSNFRKDSWRWRLRNLLRWWSPANWFSLLTPRGNMFFSANWSQPVYTKRSCFCASVNYWKHSISGMKIFCRSKLCKRNKYSIFPSTYSNFQLKQRLGICLRLTACNLLLLSTFFKALCTLPSVQLRRFIFLSRMRTIVNTYTVSTLGIAIKITSTEGQTLILTDSASPDFASSNAI
jgi:hypothetical protein